MEEMKPCAANSPPLTPLGFLERAATVYGDCTSIVYGSNTVYTWRETNLRCLRVASSLSSLGIGRSDVVSVLSPNTPAMYELQFAVPMSGAILNNINTRLDARTVSVLLTHSGSKLLFVDVFSRDLAVEAVAMMTTDPPILVFIADKEEEGGSRADAADRNKFSYTYDDLIQRGDPNFKWIRPESEWDPIVLNYTSGTTSAPKGVVHCHRGIFVISVDSLIDWTVPKNPVYLWTLPMFHANGWSYPWGIAAVGGTNVCLRKFDAPLIYRLIRDHGVTHMCGAPVVLNMLSATQESQPLNRPVNILTAGAPPPAAVLLRAESIGFVISHGYGLTETAGLNVSCAWKPQWNRLPATDRARLKARQGVRTLGFTEIDVVDPESGRGVERNGETVGEIVMKGSSVMLGYLKDPSGTEKALKNGWFYTGDVGVIHTDGYLEIKDRSKDIIITGGENVSSVEVEAVLYTNPAVSEVAVVARPDEFWGETPCAFVSLKEGLSRRPTEEELIEYCRKKMPRYMVPKTVSFRDELPKTSTGKVMKFVLREIAKNMGMTRLSRM
ncbi:PREDICTED: probable acyl-activating enzyme 5, peroxisomal isoform X2 [Camelina sativa]|uniref:Probable acyl-activating enzyme 5, peroxisomal isoform X1 n=1 Tax=Camelina sativa TaxID=90675 RepID=A0ABM0XXS4_CAMSA|nr:PREDICTED: probable acyl-activating enzyme 5, peroxisomal isoform X1 [Camelina sativa]XP_010492532.1 PREDICTED: probable acyl-activating enzyme 5, peroxisomal isoform X1 [Camelina sativa]XP_010492534.1 PREDICTED: probable acyl-activating enzyme 5, peroxisomal isoform X1 [Camelina sativa]XP_010492535.1 PREDICTED: probable acyl-activating enzyme 5, peroxisomal isoform X1 [Camelina sativa]XP_010492536.1 PREDICTED: probable acyl-activating enzyme 5, peroxisomal isoform X1 [Camelina sativa]XP_01